MKRILQSSLIIVATLVLVAGVSGAFFSDGEHSTGNTFASGVIDLMVGNESYYNGTLSTETSWVDTTSSLEGKLFFNFLDLKPDDEGEDTISLTVDTNDAWACMSVELTQNDDVSSNEPELEAGDVQDDPLDSWDGELADYMEFLWWADDGDNVYEVGEVLLSDGVQTLTDLATTSGPFMVALADSLSENPWTGNTGDPLEADSTYHIGKAWCFGTLTESPLSQDGVGTARTPIDPEGSGVICDGTDIGTPNILQTDGVQLDVSFLAMQARHDSEYVCPEPEEPPIACEVVQTYADSVVTVQQGTQRDGSTVPLSRSDTSSVLGAPHVNNTGPVDSGVPVGAFLSLGFTSSPHTSAIGASDGSASIVLSFDDNYVIDDVGDDLQLWEVTNTVNPPYPDELVTVEVSNDAINWTQVGGTYTRDATVDLASVGVGSAWRYVRITDVSSLASFPLPAYASADGYDLDAVQALNCIVSPINP